jgi:hypothetical protein
VKIRSQRLWLEGGADDRRVHCRYKNIKECLMHQTIVEESDCFLELCFLVVIVVCVATASWTQF